MKILVNCINLLRASQGAGGAGSYVDSLISQLAKLETVRVLVKPDNFLRFQKIKNLQVIPLINNDIELIHHYLSWADIYFCPLNELVPQYINSNIPIACTILDLQHEVYPQFFPHDIYQARRFHYGYAITRANGIITISEHEKNLIQKIYQKKDVYVTYLSGYLGDQFTEENINQLDNNQIIDQPYLIYPAIPWRHKNHYRLVEALFILKQKYPQFKDLKLILTGAQHSLSTSSLENLINNLGMQKSVEMRGFVSDIELANLIKYAKLMVFPSLYEGFGIPIIDSMKLGTPVLTTTCAAIPEVAQEGVAYCRNALDSQQIAEDIYNLLIDQDKLNYLGQLGQEKEKLYSAQKTAETTLQAFQDLLEKYQNNKNQIKLDYLNVHAVPKYQHCINKPKLSLILNLLEEVDEDLSKKINFLLRQNKNLYRIIAILPREFNLKINHQNFIPVYCLQDNESYFDNLLSFIFDSVLDTDYVLYGKPEKILNNNQDFNFPEVITTLDTFQHLSGAKLTTEVQHPIEVPPLNGIELLKEYDQWKQKRLEFFELIILRSSQQNQDYHLGQYKYLSKFLSEAHYLKYPMNNNLTVEQII